MISAFKARKPWAAAIITTIFSPIIGFCYLSKATIAVTYYSLYIAFVIVSFFAFQSGFLKFNPAYVVVPLVLIQLSAVIHAYRSAKNYSPTLAGKWYAHWYILILVFILLMVSMQIRHHFYPIYHIPKKSLSMAPEILPDAYIAAEKFTYLRHTPQRGDIITFITNNSFFVKRIVGLPEEKLQLINGIVYINGTPLPRKKLEDFSMQNTEGIPFVAQQFTESLPEGREYKILVDSPRNDMDNTPLYLIPEHQYFVLGDNRGHSFDSRNIGFVPEKDITGKVLAQ